MRKRWRTRILALRPVSGRLDMWICKGFPMIRFTPRQVAAITVIAASAVLTLSLAGESAAPPPAAPAAAGAAAPAQPPKLISVTTPDAPPKDYVIPKGIPDAILKAVQNPARRKEDVVRDAYRKPAEILKLANVRPGQKVIELGSFGELDKFGQYYTTMLSDVVGPKGMVYMYDPLDVDEQFGVNSKAFAAAHPNTQYNPVDFSKVEFPRNVDLVFSALFYHEMLARGIDMTVFHNKLFKALRPGGIYMIIDHASDEGLDIKRTLPLHRLDAIRYIHQDVQAAGFQNVYGSPQAIRLLERNDDDHKWTIYTPGKLDQTDQVVYVFQKPVN